MIPSCLFYDLAGNAVENHKSVFSILDAITRNDEDRGLKFWDLNLVVPLWTADFSVSQSSVHRKQTHPHEMTGEKSKKSLLFLPGQRIWSLRVITRKEAYLRSRMKLGGPVFIEPSSESEM